MRNAFRDEIYEIAKSDDRIVLLSADIGNRMFDQFKADFPDRFYNTGIAEQNMIGMAAGLAMAGLRPVCYTIANFLTYRVIEQIRVDACYHHQPVILAAVGGGLSYASLGGTHHSCEDIAMLRTLPEMRILCPGDAMEVRSSVHAAVGYSEGPTYIRLGKKGEPTIHQSAPDLAFGRWLTIRPNVKPQVTLLSCGNILPETKAAADQLDARLISCASVKPMDEDTLYDAFAQSELVVTVEEHSRLGGFGGGVAEWLTEQKQSYRARARLLRLGTPDEFLHRTGNQDYARQATGLDADSIVQSIETKLASPVSPR
jgi:transketolase